MVQVISVPLKKKLMESGIFRSVVNHIHIKITIIVISASVTSADDKVTYGH